MCWVMTYCIDVALLNGFYWYQIGWEVNIYIALRSDFCYSSNQENSASYDMQSESHSTSSQLKPKILKLVYPMKDV